MRASDDRPARDRIVRGRIVRSRELDLRRILLADHPPVPALMNRPIAFPNARRGRHGGLFALMLFVLLQCLQPLLHAHPVPASGPPEASEASEASSTSAASRASEASAYVLSVHLPDDAALWTAADREDPVPVTVVAEDDLRRAPECAFALATAAARYVVPAPMVWFRVRPPERRLHVPDPGALPGPARGPPFSDV